MSGRDPSKERLLEVYEYRDGNLYNKINRGTRGKKGARVGYPISGGYFQLQLDSKKFLLHRLVYIMHYGSIPEDLVIDHKDGDNQNNRIENLRVVTLQENSFNTKAKGYCFHKGNQKWQAKIKVGGVQKFLGYFDNEEDASQAYQVAKEKYHIIEER